MKTTFSKPLSDIGSETADYLKRNPLIMSKQQRLSSAFASFPTRESCLLCNHTLANSEGFLHRGVKFVACSQCSHIQSQQTPPNNYPEAFGENHNFSTVYPRLSFEEYLSRQLRIYQPKLSWIIDSAAEAGISLNELQSKRWLELGCGYGFFLRCLQQGSFSHVSGVDLSSELVLRANEMLSPPAARISSSSLSETIATESADIYVAFYVFEHINNAYELFRTLANCRRGTILIFSVPTFGLSTLLEGCFSTHAARNLDCVVHTQLYTDDSLQYALRLSGFTPVSQWIFGQDSSDLLRLLSIQIEEIYPSELKQRFTSKLQACADGFQAVCDRSFLSDSRHILAIKD